MDDARADPRPARPDRTRGDGQGRLRAKTTALQEALTGFFTDHHAAIPQRLSILGSPKANVHSPAAIRAHADELR
ncbi:MULTISPECIES: hypothetical protein [Kribbella]|uniref:hypothetical protein n=1 Tax=Kribbella TaxID=182639 RepID=UPI0018EE5A82|nr:MULTISPECIES: hypothetical protein [Kribbella]